MRRSLAEYKIVGVRTNIPFHQKLMDSHRFMAGSFDTRFVEQRFSLDALEDAREDRVAIAAILTTLAAHHSNERAAHIVRRNERDTSNWKWLSRWERLQR
jgi:acetyl/propionyl-CoA carboxylase alpha subunit